MKGLSPQQQKIVAWIRKHGPCIAQDVDVALRLPRGTAGRRFTELRRRGYIAPTDATRKTRPRGGPLARVYEATSDEVVQRHEEEVRRREQRSPEQRMGQVYGQLHAVRSRATAMRKRLKRVERLDAEFTVENVELALGHLSRATGVPLPGQPVAADLGSITKERRIDAAYRQLLAAHGHLGAIRRGATADWRKKDAEDARWCEDETHQAIKHIEQITGLKAPYNHGKAGRPSKIREAAA